MGPANRNREPAECNNGDGLVVLMLGGWRLLWQLNGNKEGQETKILYAFLLSGRD